MNPEPEYTLSQRGFALFWGLTCHFLFLSAIAAMASNLFWGMQLGFGPLSGWAAVPGNTLLLLSFPLIHSWLLTGKGRSLMAKLVPLGIGKELSTTTFAAIASLQLLSVFLLWSPSGIIWWQAQGWQTWAIAGMAGSAWLLLGKSMYDAQLSFQLGLLGWFAVFRKQKPKYKRFATEGLYRHVRQPIYISFALILWFSAIWTPDQLFLAIGWTLYCIVGSVLKEKRFVKLFGESFRNYQKAVPFWIPKRNGNDRGHIDRFDADVLIVGAGPIGLLLASLLGRMNIHVILVERRKELPKGSMAIGITPPSLHVLKELGVDQFFVERGVRINTAKVFENGSFVGALDFDQLPTEHPFILSLHQSETMAILQEKALSYGNVRLITEVDYLKHESFSNGVTVCVRDQKTGSTTHYSARKLIGCDGNRSRVRKQAHIGFSRKNYSTEFLMADFEDLTDFGSEAHLYFGPHGSVESFPLPHHQRRWIIQRPKHEDATKEIAQSIIEHVRKRTGMELGHCKIYFESMFRPQRGIASVYNRGNVYLCGDAAHVMSPIGGQGMNTGFADAVALSKLLIPMLNRDVEKRLQAQPYNNLRRKAFSVAASRACYGMWLGTRRGFVASSVRRKLIQKVLLRANIRRKLAPYFAMLTIPGNKALLEEKLNDTTI
ncbi:MAG: FAD-dependent monooxygenase [Opitutales bacterium]|nr:FAD-dependent monooxygenase [Opitutales bacterium]